MDQQECCNFNISVEEAEEGYKVYIKGDKEFLRPKLEAMEAWMNYQEKARAAGWTAGHKWHGWPGMHHQGPDKIKKFMKQMHRGFREAINEVKD